MWRYRLPDYKLRLLGELQRQQNSSLFCDTLLQTEGVSVPAHSCILAALSPYLSHELSASPSPSAGQRHQLQLQAVKAHTLLKLVGFFYSGELKGEGTKDQEELLSAARRLGIGCLEEGWRESQREVEFEEEQQSCKRCREEEQKKREEGRRGGAVVHTGMEGRRDRETQVEKRVFVDTGTQTADGQAMHTTTSFALPSPNKSPVPDKTDRKMGEKRDEAEQPSKRAEALQEERRGKSVDKRGMTGRAGMKSLLRMQQMDVTASTHISFKVKLRRRTRGEVWEVVGMHERDSNSVLGALKKVGVGRQFKEAVSQEAKIQSSHTVQNTYVYHKDGIKPMQQRDHTLVQPPISSPPLSQIQEQETRTPLPVLPTSPNPPPHTIISSDHQRSSCDLHTPNTGPKSAILPQLRGPVEESDEQIEKLLEDIMMGWNILPSVNLERDCNRPQHLQHNQDGAPATNQPLIPDCEARQTGTHTAVGSVHCVCCHGYMTGSDDTSSTDTGIQCSSMAQSQPRCRSSSSVHPSLMLTQHRQCPAQHRSSMTYTGEGGGSSCRDTPLSDTQDCPYREAARVRSVTPTVLYSSDQNSCGQELHYSACQEGSSNTVLCLPKPSIDSLGNAAQSPKPHSLPCGEDLFLPKCLSPLQNSPSAKCHQTAFNHFTSHGERGQQPPLKGLSLLLMNTGIVEFPLTAMVHQEQTCPSLQDTNYPCQSKQCQSRLVCTNGSVPMNGPGGTSKGLCIENKVAEERKNKKFSAASQTVAKLKSKCDRVKERSKRQREQHDDTGDNTQPAKKMRKSLSCTKNSLGQLLDYKEDGTHSQVNTRVCSVSLSSNNVLAEDRKRVRNALSMSPKYAGEPKKLSEITGRLIRAARKPRALRTRKYVVQNALKTPIGTRGYSEKTLQQGTPSDTCPETPSALGTLAKMVGIMDKVEPPKRKRGRPRKIKPEEVFHPNSAVPSAAHENCDDGSPRTGTQELQERGNRGRKKYRKRLMDKNTEADRMVRCMVQDTQNSEQTLSSCGISALEPNGDQKQNPSPENPNGTKADRRTAISPNNKLTATAEMVRSIVQDTQNPEQTSLCGISTLEPNTDQKQNSSPENADGTKTDKDTAISPDNKLTATKRMPTVTLKGFQEVIKHRHFKTRISNGNIEKKETSETEENVQSEGKALDCGKTGSSSDEVTKETKMNEDATLSQGSGAVKTYDAILGTRFNKKNCQITRADNDQSGKHEDKIEDTQPQSQDLNNNELPPETKKEKQECGKYCALKFLEVMVNALPLDGRCPTMEPDKIEHPRQTDMDEKIKDANEQMEAKARTDLEMSPREETGGPEVVGLEELHRSVIGQMDGEVDFSSEEIVIADEDHPIPCFAAIEEMRGNGEEEKIDVGEEEVTDMEIDREGDEEHLLRYPDKAQNVPESPSELDTEKSAATVDGLMHSHIHLTKENKVATASSQNPQTPQRRHPSMDIHRVTVGSTGSRDQGVEEEEEVDILSCSPEKSPQFRESGMGLNLMELIPEEEEEIDVIGEEVSFT